MKYKKGLSTSAIVVIVIVAIVVIVGGYFLIKGGIGGEPEEPLVSSTQLSSCLSNIEGKLPDSFQGYEGETMKMTTPFYWTTDMKRSEFSSEGYLNNYVLGDKVLSSILARFKKTKDYNKVFQDIQKNKEQYSQLIKEVNVKGATAYVDDSFVPQTVTWFILAGDNIFIQFSFIGVENFEETQQWVNAWADTVC